VTGYRRSRTIQTRNGGTLTFPDVEARGVTALSGWVQPSDIPGTPSWEWVVTNMPVTALAGMTAGYNPTELGARRRLYLALRFWESYGYRISPPEWMAWEDR
jgi:hypothetical protein